ncbi:glycerol-3-phosphate dehydrogenase (NAD(P)+) [Kocuria rhizophila]|uniref:NAD(P)H-dependent glycerol-3-phosphate dehydrogenase n=1 Tax=Kocuria rhizophila TaxID=72000 RepID=UPI001D736B9E|nr:NAD(P)H-dependent glycerol-3-phosphate dehydrogenase [Kocuria rhizophila]MCC5671794.1 NAD(P)-dependent glycerol-3-phosphate dehydrogenase [Kocuria rhizophila]MCC5673871.1 NAD(P)-dependent glycerol-3-phosphate dehydrogenase [Kocuria rhizophila]MDV5998942.1 NAD(P)-dependent glycerol-3-phosphate dehydrogenase [Kocuria rhizophila]
MSAPGRGPAKITVLGAGSWGTTFAKVLADAAVDAGAERTVCLWGRNPEAMAGMARERRNERYVPGIELPAALTYSSELPDALHGAELVVAAIPAQSLRAQLELAAPHVAPDAVVLSLAKGLESSTGLRMTQVVAEVLAEGTGVPEQEWARRTGVLSGPNLAMEIAREEPTASVVAAPEHGTAAWVARCCAAPYFRPYTNTDVVGTEIGGLVKNVIALCVGICDGRGYGDNSKASVMTRGLAETTRLALALGGSTATLSGLSGMGDLVATCSSSLSRNHTAGRLLGSGLTLAQVQDAMTQTAEGIKSAPAVLELARRHGVDMPITEAVVGVLRGEAPVHELAPRLLGRDLKSEGNHA